MKYMLPAMISSILTMTSLVTHATNISIDRGGDQCQYRINSKVNIKDDQVTITNTQGNTLHINDSNQVRLNNQLLSLTATKKADFVDYKQHIIGTGKQLEVITANALQLAEQAVSDVVYSLFAIPKAEAATEIATVKHAVIDNTFYNSDGEFELAIDSQDYQGEHSIDVIHRDAFDDVVGDALGNIVSKAMKSDSELSLFERLAKLSEASDEIEQYAEEHSEVIGQQAEQFCQDLATLEKIENKITDHHPELSDWDVIARDTSISQPLNKRLK